MGDVLFSLVNVARKMGVQAEEALRATCGKFRARWAFMEGAGKAYQIETRFSGAKYIGSPSLMPKASYHAPIW